MSWKLLLRWEKLSLWWKLAIFYVILVALIRLLLLYLTLHPLLLFTGFFYAIVCGHYPIAITSRELWIKATGRVEDPKSTIDTSAIVGWLERWLYVASLLVSHAEFIGVWLVLKTAGRIWSGEDQAAGAPSRTIYQLFLIGNALSIGYAIIGWKIIVLLPIAPWYAVALIIAVLIGNLVLYAIVRMAPSREIDACLEYVEKLG